MDERCREKPTKKQTITYFAQTMKKTIKYNLLTMKINTKKKAADLAKALSEKLTCENLRSLCKQNAHQLFFSYSNKTRSRISATHDVNVNEIAWRNRGAE